MVKFNVSIPIFFMLVLMAVSVYAATPVVRYTATTDTINSSDLATPAVYSFTIVDTAANPDRYQLYTISSFWDVYPTIVSVAAGSGATFNLEISLTNKQLIGPQLVPVTIKSLGSGDTDTENLYVYVKPTNATVMGYTPNVAMDVKMNDEIDPRQPISIDVHMLNRNPLNINELKIVVESDLFSKEYITNLGALEEKTNQILFTDLNTLQQPGIYNITISLVTQNKTITQVQKQVHVIGYSDISVEDTKIRGLFSYTEKIKLNNDGNYEAIKSERIPKNFFERMFTTTSVKYKTVSDNGVSYISWNVPLQPQESYEITITTSYNILAIIFIVAIALVILYYIFRSPVLLFKRAKIVSSNEDGISEARVKLHLKNRSGMVIRNIKVIDKYPKIVTLVEDNSLGTLKPTKMLSADKIHSLLMWNIDSLEPYEERLLSYTVRSRLNIVGNLSLHPARVRFVTPAGERTYTSNDVVLQHKSENIVTYE